MNIMDRRQNSVYTPKSNLNQSFNDADGYNRNIMNNLNKENSR